MKKAMFKRVIALLLSLVLFLNMGILVLLAATDGEEALGYGENKVKLLEGKKISIIGDSISTYMGWSDAQPITDEDCRFRYGEPYYGGVGSDCHNTELLVEDTWWHQAAAELGAEILVNSSGNSTGVFCAEYPQSADWDQYLKEMLAYKSRPNHLGTSDASPDIIALYIGSNEVARASAEVHGSIADIDFDTLVSKNADGTISYNEPTTVAEAYCIMMEKLRANYPNAEIYCFTLVPNSGGYLSTVNGRLKNTLPINALIKDIANHYGAVVVDLFDAFALDPDYDAVATEEDFAEFKTCFNGDPHPNAKGFDVISRCFVDAVLKNSKYIVEVESFGGVFEQIGVNTVLDENKLLKWIDGFVSQSGMIVDYTSTLDLSSTSSESFKESYISKNVTGSYIAEGGLESTSSFSSPSYIIKLPLTATESETLVGRAVGTILDKSGSDITIGDGVYDYIERSIIRSGGVTIRTESISVLETILHASYEDMSFISSSAIPTPENQLITAVNPLVPPSSPEEVPTIADGYEFIYLGSDKFSQFYAAFAYNVPDYEGYPDEPPVYTDENYTFYVHATHPQFIRRNLIVPRLYIKGQVIETPQMIPARYESIQQFTLSNAAGQIITAYCADQNCPAVKGFSYRLTNLQDSTYFSPDEAKKIRAIVNNAYWGTESGFGSLSSLKSALRDSGKFTEAEIAMVTDGIALTATQYAIWSFSNINDSKVFFNTYMTNKPSGGSMSAADKQYTDILFKLYNYFVDLEPEEVLDKTTADTVINEKNFLDSVSLNVNDKPDVDANKDADDTNDIYGVDISFTLKVKPSEENGDDLVLKIIEGDKTIAIGRIAGKLAEGEIQLNTNESGIYTFEDLNIAEGANNIRFLLVGSQHLARDAYMLISEEIDRETSQTLVGLAEGKRSVNVAMDISFTFEVEDEKTKQSHHWRAESFFGSVNGIKTDENSYPIESVLFGIFAPDATVLTEETALYTTKTNAKGEFAFTNIPLGKYILRELSCPNGYVPYGESILITLDDYNTPVTPSVVNKRIEGTVEVIKYGSDTEGKTLSGAVFEVYIDANGNKTYEPDTDTLVGQLTETKAGYYTLGELVYGEYLLCESEAPSGYIRDENYYAFSITEDGQTVTVENRTGEGFVNEQIPFTGENDKLLLITALMLASTISLLSLAIWLCKKHIN